MKPVLLRCCRFSKALFRYRMALLLVASTALSACSGGPPPKLYLLEAPSIDTAEQATQAVSLDALGVSQVELPSYASDARIASLGADGVVLQSNGQRWAEEPEEAITRLLANRLRQRASATVLVEPWPRDFSPQARIEVVFDRLLREPDGGASLSGQIYLVSGDGRTLLQSVDFNRVVPGFSLHSTAFFRSIAVAVDEIARIAVESLLAPESTS